MVVLVGFIIYLFLKNGMIELSDKILNVVVGLTHSMHLVNYQMGIS